jgi:hypothetical protein
MEDSSNGCPYTRRVPRFIVMYFGKSFWEQIANIREHIVV